MPFLLAILSMLGYATHNLLISKYARKMDTMSLAMYRNLSLIIGMSPLLFFITLQDFQQLPSVLPTLLAGSFCGAISINFHYKAYNYLPIGIVSALTKLRILLLALWAYLFLGETLSPQQLFIILIIIAAITFLSLQDNKMPHLKPKTKLGFLFAFCNVFFVSIAFFLLSKASRLVNPLMAGYIWEIGIGLFVLLFLIIRQLNTSQKIEKITNKKLLKITSIASLTTIGTGGFALAVQQLPIAIVSAILATGTILITSAAHFYHQEKLKLKQWLGIVLIILSIIALKIL